MKDKAVGRIGGGRYKYGVHVVSEFIGHKPGHFGGCSKYFNQHYLAERHFLVADELPDRFPKGIVKRQAAEVIPLQDAEKLVAQIGPDDQADQEEQHDHYGQRDQIDNPGVDGVGKGKQFADGRDKPADEPQAQIDQRDKNGDGQHHDQTADHGGDEKALNLPYPNTPPFPVQCIHTILRFLPI